MPEPRRTTDASFVRRLAPLAVVLLVLAACAKVAGIDSLEIGECKGGVCAAEAGDLDAPVTPPEEADAPPPVEAGTFDASKPCPGTAGPVMVRVGTESNNFCIDSSEVTVKQYTEFTTAKGTDVSGQPKQCSWNTSYAPAAGGPDEIPIAGVDWCDAYAYCKWAGKRLCGKHANGKYAGPVPTADLLAFTSHEWLVACSNLGQLRYPYGSLQQPTTCNTGENDAGRTLAVKSKASCQGGFTGVYDMVGNVWEWFDGPCNPPDAGPDAAAAVDAGPQKDECVVKGGSFLEVGANLDCRVNGLGATRDRRGIEIGVRCCSD
jgi:formylglycine-generating enzyme required for sulfatase activity